MSEYFFARETAATLSLESLSPIPANRMLYTAAVDEFAVTPVTAFGLSLLDLVDATALGVLFSGVFQPADTDLTAIAGITRNRGDLIVGGASAWVDLALGTSGYHLQSDGTDAGWAGFLQTGTGATTRTWQNKARDIWHAKDFGVIADGTTDNTAALQAVATAANVAGGATILLPSGTIRSGTVKWPNGVHWEGATTESTVWKLKASTNANLLVCSTWFNDEDFVNLDQSISNLTLDGNRFVAVTNATGATSGHCLIVRSFRFRASGLNVQNAAGSGIVQSSTDSAGTHGRAAAECIYDIIRFSGNKERGFYGFDNGTFTMSDGILRNCTWTTNGDGGFYQLEIERSAGWHIEHPNIYGDFAGNAKLSGNDRTCISGGHIGLFASQGSASTTYRSLNVGSSANTGLLVVGTNFVDEMADVATSTYCAIDLSDATSILHLAANAFQTSGVTNPRAIARTAGVAATGLIGMDNRFVGYTTAAKLGQGYADIASFTPPLDDGLALGTTAKTWSDLFLASGAVINFNGGDVTITHAANALDISGGVVNFGSSPTVGGTNLTALYQPLDADLTAIAALAGTNNIYYRSGASTWSSVTIGSNLGFSAGTLGSSLGTAATATTGTNGTTVPFLSGNNTTSGNWIFNLSSEYAEPVIFQETFDTGTPGPFFTLKRVRANPAANDAIGYLQWVGNNTAHANVTYAAVDCYMPSVTSGAETSRMRFYLYTAGVSSQEIQIGNGLVLGLATGGPMGVGTINFDAGMYRDGTQVVGAQGAAVADASGGAVIDAEARTALNALLARLRTHGLIST